MKQKTQNLQVHLLVKQYDPMISQMKKKKVLTDSGGGPMSRFDGMKAVEEEPNQSLNF